MICSQCGFQLPEDASFCTNCGKRLAPAEETLVTDPVAETAPETPVFQNPPQPQYMPPQYAQSQYAYAQPTYHNYAPAPEKPVIPPEYRPIGPWGYFGWQLLFAIPIVGFILLIVFACGAVSNINLKNFARSYFCALLIFAIIVTVFVILGYVAAGRFYYLF